MESAEKALLALKALRRSLQMRNFYLNRAGYLYRQLFGKRFTIRCLSGTERYSGLPLNVLYVGEGDSSDYLKSLFFADAGIERILGSQSLRNVIRGDAPDLGTSGIRVREFTPRILRFSKQAGQFTTPEWMEQEISLHGSWDDVVNRFRKNTRSTDLRKVRKYNFGCDVVQDRTAIEYFYDHLYLPYVSERFQGAAQIIDREWLVAVASTSGLLRILKDGDVVAGAVLHYDRKFLDWIWIGAKKQNGEDLDKGVFSALYYHSIKHAHEKGFERMRIGNTRTFLNDGVYRYKRKWGAHLVRGRYADTRLLLDFDFEAPAVRSWLQSSPFVTESKAGFVANSFCFEPDAGNAAIARIRELVSPGLAEIRVHSPDLLTLPSSMESCRVTQVSLQNSRNRSRPTIENANCP